MCYLITQEPVSLTSIFCRRHGGKNLVLKHGSLVDPSGSPALTDTHLSTASVKRSEEKLRTLKMILTTWFIYAARLSWRRRARPYKRSSVRSEDQCSLAAVGGGAASPPTPPSHDSSSQFLWRGRTFIFKCLNSRDEAVLGQNVKYMWRQKLGH